MNPESPTESGRMSLSLSLWLDVQHICNLSCRRRLTHGTFQPAHGCQELFFRGELHGKVNFCKCFDNVFCFHLNYFHGTCSSTPDNRCVGIRFALQFGFAGNSQREINDMCIFSQLEEIAARVALSTTKSLWQRLIIEMLLSLALLPLQLVVKPRLLLSLLQRRETLLWCEPVLLRLLLQAPPLPSFSLLEGFTLAQTPLLLDLPNFRSLLSEMDRVVVLQRAAWFESSAG